MPKIILKKGQMMLSFVLAPETEMLCVCLGDCPVFIIIKFFTYVVRFKIQSIVTYFGDKFKLFSKQFNT